MIVGPGRRDLVKPPVPGSARRRLGHFGGAIFGQPECWPPRGLLALLAGHTKGLGTRLGVDRADLGGGFFDRPGQTARPAALRHLAGHRLRESRLIRSVCSWNRRAQCSLASGSQPVQGQASAVQCPSSTSGGAWSDLTWPQPRAWHAWFGGQGGRGMGSSFCTSLIGHPRDGLG